MDIGINTGLNGRKGQKSLEMIIGLVILLVVAAVVISMFLDIFENPDIGQESVDRSEIEQQCSQKCEQWKDGSQANVVDYCTSTFAWDNNGDGSTQDMVRQGYNSYCEDGVHCFNIHSCQRGARTELDPEGCMEQMCQYFLSDRGGMDDPGAATSRIQDLYSRDAEDGGYGSCDLPNAMDDAGYEINTWYHDLQELDCTEYIE